MAEIRINATGGLKLYDADDSHYAQILAGTISSNVDALTLGSSSATFGLPVTVGEDDTGHDVKLFGATASRYWLWDESADGVVQRGTLTVGVDDTGHDVKLFGASAGAYMEWDESEDQLRIMGASADATTSTGKLLLATSLTDINANDVIGKIEFQAPHEAGGTDAITVAASIKAVAQSTFSSSSNATDLIFYTGHSEAAAEKIRITSQNEIGIAGANYGSDGQVLTSGGAGAAVAWEDAGGGDLSFGGDTFGADKVIGSNDDYDLTFETNNTARLNLANGGKIHTGGETDGGTETSAGGICIDTNAEDRGPIVWKNSDVGHTFTNDVEADTVMEIRKLDLPTGGVRIRGFGESPIESALNLDAWCDGSIPTGKTENTGAAMNLSSAGQTSNAAALIGTTANILAVKNHNKTRFIIQGDGNFYADGSSNASNWDVHEDANMVRSLDLSLAKAHGENVVDSKFDKFVKYNHEKLADLGLVGREKDGTPNSFICISRLQRLHNGAIWQQHEKHNQLLEAVYDLAKEAVGEEKANAILEKNNVKLLN